jgi:anaerobic magnesium-protoporphyrin IX monomethyl ester cyclase
MIDVLLTHSYFLRFDPKEHKAMMPYPPLGTLYAASTLSSKGYSVELFDSMLAQHESEIIPFLNRFHPKVVVIYDDDFNYLTKMCLRRMRRAAFELSRHAKQYGCSVVVHGSDSADHVEEYLEHDADFVIVGEGEQTLIELVDHLLGKNQREISSIQGLSFRSEYGRVTDNPKRAVMRDLDAISFPAWNLVDVERYRRIWKRRHGYFSMNMVTTRGCPFHCNWCAKPIYGQVYNVRSPGNVVEEMTFLKRTYQPDHLWFCDDIFGLKPGWVPAFAELVNLHDAKIPFKCLARVDLLLHGRTVEHLAHAGCKTVWVGAESGSQKILDAMEKGTTIKQVYEATHALHEHGIRVGFFLQFGYPGETKEEIEQTLRMVKDCRPEEIGISVSYPLPGTKFYDSVKAQLGEKQNWIDSRDLDVMFRGTYPRDYYRVLHRVVHKKFSVWKNMRLLKSILQNPFELRTRSLRSLAAVIYNGTTLPLQLRKLHQLEQAAR